MGISDQICSVPRLDRGVVVTIAENEIQSHPYFTIRYTYNETLGQYSSCKLLVLLQTNLILV